MRSILVLLVCLACLNGQAQNEKHEVVWMPPAVGDKKWKPLVGFDSRRSFFNDRSVKFLGLRFGAEHRGVHSFGIGFYGMTRGETYLGVNVPRPDATDPTIVRFEAGFATLFYERVVMQAGPWKVSVPVYFGGGTLRGSYKDILDNYKPFLEEPFSVFGLGVMGKYRILPWLEPGLGGGFRFVYNSNTEVRKTLQQPYYVLKVSILLGEFYRHVILDP